LGLFSGLAFVRKWGNYIVGYLYKSYVEVKSEVGKKKNQRHPD
jgi:hypothetical protein